MSVTRQSQVYRCYTCLHYINYSPVCHLQHCDYVLIMFLALWSNISILFTLADIFSSNLKEIIQIKDDCFTLVPLGSSFKLAAVDVTASSYSSSAGSSFTFTNGGEGDKLVSACVVSYNRQRTRCSIIHSKHLAIDLIYMYK